MLRKTTVGVVVAMFSLALLEAKGSSILFTDFGSGLTFDETNEYYVGEITTGKATVGNYVVAAPFSPSSNALFEDVIVAASLPVGGQFSLFLEADNGGLPGAILDQATVTCASFCGAGPTTVASVLHPSLTVGTTYWLVMQDITNDVGDGAEWNLNNSGFETANGIAFNANGSSTGPWSRSINQPVLPAFQIDGSTAPELSSNLLFFSGLIGIVLVGCFRTNWEHIRNRTMR